MKGEMDRIPKAELPPNMFEIMTKLATRSRPSMIETIDRRCS